MSALPPKADILRCGKERRYSITSSATEQRNWECDAERFRGLEADDKIVFGRCSHRHDHKG
jgi:hypothetical protein